MIHESKRSNLLDLWSCSNHPQLDCSNSYLYFSKLICYYYYLYYYCCFSYHSANLYCFYLSHRYHILMFYLPLQSILLLLKPIDSFSFHSITPYSYKSKNINKDCKINLTWTIWFILLSSAYRFLLSLSFLSLSEIRFILSCSIIVNLSLSYLLSSLISSMFISLYLLYSSLWLVSRFIFSISACRLLIFYS